jgi:hypothetical protein
MMSLQAIPVIPIIIFALVVWNLVEEAVSAGLRVVRFGLLFVFVVALANGRSKRLVKLAHRPLVGALRRVIMNVTGNKGVLGHLLQLLQGLDREINDARKASGFTEGETAPKA